MYAFIFSLLLAASLLSIGSYQVAADIIQLPKFASTRMALNLTRKDSKKTSLYEAFLFTISEKLSKIIHLTDFKRETMIVQLKGIGISIPPEMWIAKAYVKFGIYLITSFIAIPILPLFFPILLLTGVRELYRLLQLPEIELRKKRESIESDLPRFAATIALELKSTRNVLAIFEGYVDTAGPGLQDELKITITDMRSGPQETALIRLKSRVNSPMLKDVVQGLLSVLRGDDGVQYFGWLAHDFKRIEIQKLKLEAAKRPIKVRVYSGLLLLLFLLTYVLIIVIQAMQSMAMFHT